MSYQEVLKNKCVLYMFMNRVLNGCFEESSSPGYNIYMHYRRDQSSQDLRACSYSIRPIEAFNFTKRWELPDLEVHPSCWSIHLMNWLSKRDHYFRLASAIDSNQSCSKYHSNRTHGVRLYSATRSCPWMVTALEHMWLIVIKSREGSNRV